MSATIDQRPGAEVLPGRSDTLDGRPRLLAGTELLGQAKGSGLREPPYLVRRRDGQIVQLSRLLYELASAMDGRSPAAIAHTAGERLDLRITPQQVVYVAEHKLFPLGLVVPPDGRVPHLQPRNPLLALRFRARLLPARTVNALAALLKPLLWPPVVLAALSALVACDAWMTTSPGVGAALHTVINDPTLGVALIGVTLLSLVFHECGHAAACRYGGARPGRIGVGIYLVWPALFTDVTDSYRLSKAGRLRTDLGGVYFNVLFALAAAGTYFATGYGLLLIVIVTQQVLILDQFVPWMRLDGYHIVSDLIGVSDLFSRIKPVMASLLPGRRPGPRVTELKRWARLAVTVWVLTTIVALAAMVAMIIIDAPAYVAQAWQSLFAQFDWVRHGAQTGSVLDVLTGAISVVMLMLPVVGFTLTYLLLCRGLGTSLAVRQSRADLTLLAVNRQESRSDGPTNESAASNRSAHAGGWVAG